MLVFLLNDFLLMIKPKSTFFTTSQLEPFTDNQFIMYKEVSGKNLRWGV